MGRRGKYTYRGLGEIAEHVFEEKFDFFIQWHRKLAKETIRRNYFNDFLGQEVGAAFE